MGFSNLRAIIEFVYRGEIDVSESELQVSTLVKEHIDSGRSHWSLALFLVRETTPKAKHILLWIVFFFFVKFYLWHKPYSVVDCILTVVDARN